VLVVDVVASVEEVAEVADAVAAAVLSST